MLTFAAHSGTLGDDVIEAVARLRLRVFRAWPYLYDGTMAYERNYLGALTQSADAVVVVARSGGLIAGAATGMPLINEHDAFARPLAECGFDVSKIFYCAESVLDPAYRGQGAGHVFFDLREAHARTLGATRAVFCALNRDAQHPLNPGNAPYLHDFWRKRGYAPVSGLTTTYAWKDIGEHDETEKSMQYWMKDL